MHLDATKVVVVGGGYAGVMAANRLTRREDVDVTVISPRPRFAGLVKQLAHEGHKPGSYSWPVGNPKRRQQLLARGSGSPGRRAVAARDGGSR